MAFKLPIQLDLSKVAKEGRQQEEEEGEMEERITGAAPPLSDDDDEPSDPETQNHNDNDDNPPQLAPVEPVQVQPLRLAALQVPHLSAEKLALVSTTTNGTTAAAAPRSQESPHTNDDNHDDEEEASPSVVGVVANHRHNQVTPSIVAEHLHEQVVPTVAPQGNFENATSDNPSSSPLAAKELVRPVGLKLNLNALVGSSSSTQMQHSNVQPDNSVSQQLSAQGSSSALPMVEEEATGSVVPPLTVSVTPLQKGIPSLNLNLLSGGNNGLHGQFNVAGLPNLNLSANTNNASSRSSNNNSLDSPLSSGDLHTTPVPAPTLVPFAQHTQKTTRTVHVDFLISDMCEFQLPSSLNEEDQQHKYICDEVHKSWFGPIDQKSSGTSPSKKAFELYKLVPYDGSSNEDSTSTTLSLVCKQLETDFSTKLLKHLLYENKMLKVKMEKSAQALSTFEKENQRLRKEAIKQKSANSATVPVPPSNMTVGLPSSDKEIEQLKQKLQKHEQLRSEMIKTVDSLKRQHALLTQAILSQQASVLSDLEAQVNENV